MAMTVEKISAVTFRVSNMEASVHFYRDALGMEVLYGGEDSGFSSLRASDAESAILNLEVGELVTRWGRLIFHVADVDASWRHLTDLGFRLVLTANPITCSPFVSGPIDHTRDGAWPALDAPFNVTITRPVANSSRVAYLVDFMGLRV